MVTVLMLGSATIGSADTVLVAWEVMVDRNTERQRTELMLLTADLVATSTDVDVSLRNSGQTLLRDFEHWDVTMQYYATSSNQNLELLYVPYVATSTPSSGEWTVEDIYLSVASSTPEVYDPDVLNPGEELVVRIKIDPTIPTSTDNLITISTPNGVTISAPFSR